MPINAHPDYLAAEKEYLAAQTLEEKIEKLKKMISLSPGHKGAENLRAQLRTRLKKLLEKQEKSKKKPVSKQGIKKHDMQAVLVGKENSGKSSLLKLLTNAEPKISELPFTTTEPQIGMLEYAGTQIQLIENPAIDSENYDKGLTNNTDTILIIVTRIEEIEEILNKINANQAKKIIVFNKIDVLNQNQKRKLEAYLSSKKYNYILISTKTPEGIEELKGKIFQSFDKIRIYTKEPGKEIEINQEVPLVLPRDSTIKDVAEKILKGFSEQIKETRIWGPSSKFPGQVVGLKHIVEDMDIVEFKTK